MACGTGCCGPRAPDGEGRTASRGDLETEIARQIQQVFAAGDAHSAELRAEIATVLREINAEHLRSAVVAAIGELSMGFGRLAGQRAGPGILVVTGASGAGKSSLLRADLLPALARGLQLPESATCP